MCKPLLGGRVGGLTEDNESLRGEVKRLLGQCTALSGENTRLRDSVSAAGGTVDNPPPQMPAGTGLHSFPFPLNLSLCCPVPLNLSSRCAPYSPKLPVDVA